MIIIITKPTVSPIETSNPANNPRYRVFRVKLILIDDGKQGMEHNEIVIIY